MNRYKDLKVLMTLEYYDYPLSELLKDPIKDQLYFTFITSGRCYLVLPITFSELRSYIENDSVVNDMFIHKDVFITDCKGDLNKLYISDEESKRHFSGDADLVWLFSYDDPQSKENALYCLGEMEKKFNNLKHDEDMLGDGFWDV